MAAQTKAIAAPKAVVRWKGEQIRVSFSDVKNLICRLATDQEVAVFLKTCQSLQLNPFANEIYLVKYTEKDKAATVISIGSYLKAAEANENYNGSEAGIILRDSGGQLEFREGAFLLEEELDRLVGGWAKVYRKNRDRPVYTAVNKAECIRYTRDGHPTQFWTKEKQASMLRKTALKRALVEAFPSLFAGTVSTAEASGPVEGRHEAVVEGELPPALERGGRPDWRKFWARVKQELGLTTEEARLLLGVESIKEEMIDAGFGMDRIWDELVAALRRQPGAAGRDQGPPPAEGVPAGGDRGIPPEEGVFREVEPAAAAAGTGTPVGAPVLGRPRRDPETVRTINELLQACNQDFQMQPKDVYGELNVKSAGEIAELPSECFRLIQAARL